MNPFIPETQLRVFISSAMNAEEDLIWLEYRKKLKDTIEKCPYFKAFTIEKQGSELPSRAFMLSQVERADIVVLLVNNDFRKGTQEEYLHAIEKKKPILVFLNKNSNPAESVKALKNDIINNDRCLFKELDSFEGAENIILDNLIINVINTYLTYHYSVNLINSSQNGESESGISQIFDYNIAIPTKTVISQFFSSYSEIYSLIGYPSLVLDRKTKEKSDLHDIGIKTLDWLINGTPFLDEKLIDSLVNAVTQIYEDTDWYKNRLYALKSVSEHDYKTALQYEEQAYELSRGKMPHWIQNNILIDLRNIEIKGAFNRSGLSLANKYQKLISESRTNVYLPLADRYLENAFEILTKDEINRTTADYGTVYYGNSITRIITELENCLFSSLLYGSYTHLINVRENMAKIFYKIGKLYEDETILYNSMKLYLLSGKYKEFVRLTNHEWKTICNIMITHADELWDQLLRIKTPCLHESRIAFLFRLGLYLSDSCFDEAENYLVNLSEDFNASHADYYFQCITVLITRLDNSKVVSSLNRILKQGRYTLANKLNLLICSIDYNNIEKDLACEFCNTLSDNMTYIMSHNGNPQIITYLIKNHPAIFHSLKDAPNNGLVGDEKLLFDINMGEGNWCEIVKEEMKIARSQFHANCKSGVYAEFATNPYSIISYIVESKIQDIESILIDDYFPLCIEVLTSSAHISVKDQCAESLCDVLGYYKSNSIDIPENIIATISNVELAENRGMNVNPFSSNGSLNSRLITLKVLCGLVKKEELLIWCFCFERKATTERLALIKCLYTFLKYSCHLDDDIDLTLISIIFQCCEDENLTIRKYACSCLAIILNSRYKMMVESKLHQMTIDSAPAVRKHIIDLCNNSEIKDETIVSKIFDTLEKDDNYMIRFETALYSQKGHKR